MGTPCIAFQGVPTLGGAGGKALLQTSFHVCAAYRGANMKKVARSLMELEGLDGLFPLLLPPQGGQVEIVIRPQKDIDATPGCRVRMQDIIALA